MQTIKVYTPIDIKGYDIYIGSDQRIATVEENEDRAQDVAILLKTTKGEDVFRPNWGVDWFSVFAMPTDAVLEDALRSAFKDFPDLIGITEITVLSRNYSTRTMIIRLVLNFTTGPIIVETTVGQTI